MVPARVHKVSASPLDAEEKTHIATTSVEGMVASAFPDKPIMVDIARCESQYRQYESPGVVLMGGGGGNYIGIFQIGKQWVPRAKSMGMDVYTTEGNIAFARYLLDNAGLTQWECYTAHLI